MYKWLVCLCVLVGCAPNPSDLPRSSLEAWMQAQGKMRVLSTTAMIDDVVGQIGGERIVHIPLISGEIDPHSYELVKGDDEKLSSAQVIFYNGLGLEHGASLRYQLQSHSNTVAVGDAILKAHPEQVIAVDHQIDPHVWMDIRLWSEMIPAIVQALEKIDPEGADLFRKNGALVQQEMLDADGEINADLQRIPEKRRYLVTSHDAFNYFTRAYLATPEEQLTAQWRKRFEAPEGLAPDGQLASSDIQKIVTHLMQYAISVIFAESNISRDSLNKIVHACRQKGFAVRLSPQVLYGDAMGEKGSDADTYLKMVRHNADAMIQAWKEEDKNAS